MSLFDSIQAMGDVVTMKTNNPAHVGSDLTYTQKTSLGSESKGFGEVLETALNSVNQLEMESEDLSQLMVTDPDEVDVHDITIAMGQANLALNITKAVVDKALQAYKEIINMR